ncbi:hypothetical protein MTR67_014485 [Solanum verrucosum]|uniref:Uncharacterized protein n=1 Tax=Solanum verrucosum TaxID=315347 RepID=A0AAF0TN51_SOLVR|nr:hypothetical protein MTR67_014483 [Solanum verrucosum]WMV21100.1 hypothetical protein MTR67_014485 [Solanum verrucosum]
MGKGTPVKFVLKVDNDDDDVVRETDDIDIMFSTLDISINCTD